MALVRHGHRNRELRHGAAVVELAVLAPFLVFLLLIAVDFARIFYAAVILDNCARNGAMYEADPYIRVESPYKTTAEAALADAPNLMSDPNNLPKVTSTTGVDEVSKPYVEVTVSHKFTTVSKFPGIPNDVTLVRTVKMARAPLNPTK
ncbi:MAG TPA: TadE/TadG family type IV pilus assembly protein [Gemmataceae bacterium]|nr:TadE/TadG family type IV pilus assembly protein [Gemmataceae bacterium]